MYGKRFGPVGLLQCHAKLQVPGTTLDCSQEIAVLAELYNMLPQHLHYLVPMNHFSNVVFSKVVCAGHASKLNKLRNATGQIFELPQSDFAISYTHNMEPKIHQLLGITGKARNIVDHHHKTLFGNWQPITKTLSCCLKGRTSLSNKSRRQGGTLPNAVKLSSQTSFYYHLTWNFPKKARGRPQELNMGRDSADDLQEEMCLTQLGLAADADEDPSDTKDANLYMSIDILTKTTGTITIGDSDGAPGPPSTSPITTAMSVLTAVSNSPSIGSLQVYHGPVEETEIVVIKETDIQAVKMKTKVGQSKKSKVVQGRDSEGSAAGPP
ncbi:hypothetical protein EDB19DRAFT_1836773 [Suillus lakei]|nr:hypothetical protein EDB19DRAFT_1836773 [Suillus lakei]